MTHLKHSGPIRQAAHAKRTALVEILSDHEAPNSPLFHAIDESATAEARKAAAELEAFYERADRAREAAKKADPYRHDEADATQRAELNRMPLGGYLA